jgi:hypothetical protein
VFLTLTLVAERSSRLPPPELLTFSLSPPSPCLHVRHGGRQSALAHSIECDSGSSYPGRLCTCSLAMPLPGVIFLRVGHPIDHGRTDCKTVPPFTTDAAGQIWQAKLATIRMRYFRASLYRWIPLFLLIWRHPSYMASRALRRGREQRPARTAAQISGRMGPDSVTSCLYQGRRVVLGYKASA